MLCGSGQFALSRTDSFSGKSMAVSDVSYEQACILFNLGMLCCLAGDFVGTERQTSRRDGSRLKIQHTDLETAE